MKNSSFKKALEEHRKKSDDLHDIIGEELAPFIDGALKINVNSKEFRTFKESYQYFMKAHVKKHALFISLLKQYKDQPDIKNKILALFGYLGIVETLGNGIVDILVILVVMNGRDFHIESRGFGYSRIRHAISIENDLEKERVPLGIKLSFLRENGLRKITSLIDTDLRNSIAHLKFEIEENEIYLKVKSKGKVKRKLIFPMLFDSMVDVISVCGFIEGRLSVLAEEIGVCEKVESYYSVKK